MTTLPRARPLLAEAGMAGMRAGKPSVVRAFFGDVADPADDEGSPAVAARCDHAALVSMYGELAPRVHRFLRDLLRDPALASDATQETFVRAFRRVGDLAPATSLVPWVFGVARFVALELRKARGRSRRVIDEHAAVDDRAIDARGRSPEDTLLDREALAVIELALERLPEDRRAVLLLRLDHGLSYGEIAPLMGWSLAKVKIEIFRAREVLRATFEEYRGGLK